METHGLHTFHFLSLFPDVLRTYMSCSILGRAERAQLFSCQYHQLRDYAEGAHCQVDDVAYGGGGGMVLRVDVLVRALESILEQIQPHACETIYFSPRGCRLDHTLVTDIAATPKHWILVCGHYEGVDQRFIDGWVDREISLGDFVLTGGELPALAFADAVARQCRGTLGAREAARTESFALSDEQGRPLLEYEHFTRPPEFRGASVPEILLSGDHVKIERWRQDRSRSLTRAARPDLLE